MFAVVAPSEVPTPGRSDVATACIVVFDSLYNDHALETYNDVADGLRALCKVQSVMQGYSGRYDRSTMPLLVNAKNRQQNPNDCGVFVIEFARAILYLTSDPAPRSAWENVRLLAQDSVSNERVAWAARIAHAEVKSCLPKPPAE